LSDNQCKFILRVWIFGYTVHYLHYTADIDHSPPHISQVKYMLYQVTNGHE